MLFAGYAQPIACEAHPFRCYRALDGAPQISGFGKLKLAQCASISGLPEKNLGPVGRNCFIAPLRRSAKSLAPGLKVRGVAWLIGAIKRLRPTRASAGAAWLRGC